MPSPARITAGELVLVCSHYDVGVVDSVRRFKGGSRHSPKVLLSTRPPGPPGPATAYLLKRRAPGGPDQAERVALTHEIVKFLLARGFPVPHLIRTRAGGTMLALDGRFYEMFRFVSGRAYDRSPEAAGESGRLLAVCHAQLREFPGRSRLVGGTFHNHPAAGRSIESLRDRLSDPRARSLAPALADAYAYAADRAEELGVAGLPSQPTHADWHPGNVVFDAHAPAILAVVDFDSVRLAPAVLDLANGALQFAIGRRLAPPDDSDPGMASELLRVSLNPDLLRAFVTGYRAAGGQAGPDELRAIPWLMVQALIVEAVVPILATGTFGKVDPVSVLTTVERTTGWISVNAERLVGLLAGQ